MAHHSMSYLQDDSSGSSSDSDDSGSHLVIDHTQSRISAVATAAGRRSPSVSFNTALQNVDDCSDLWESAVVAPAAAAGSAASAAAAPPAAAAPAPESSALPSAPPAMLRRVTFREQQLTGDEISLLLHEALFNPAHVPAAFRGRPPSSVPIELDVALNRIESLACIQPMIESGVPLRALHAARNHIASIERAFTLCTALVDLDLSGNQLVSLRHSGLAVCTQLQRVSLHSNRLRDVDELLRHPSITHLDIAHNDVDDGDSLLYALSSMPALTSLNVTEGNAAFRVARSATAGQQGRARVVQALPRLTVLDDQPVQPVPSSKRAASPVSQKRAPSPSPSVGAASGSRGRSASPAPAVARTGSGVRPPSPRVGGVRRAPSPAAPRAPSAPLRAPSPAAAAAATVPPVGGPSSSTAAPLRATPHGTPRGTPRSASPAIGPAPSASPAPVPMTLALGEARSHADPVTVSLTRELLELNQQLIDTTNELTKSEAKRVEIGRLAKEQERRQDHAMAPQPMAVSMVAAPAEHTAASHNPLEEMKSLLLGRAHRRHMSGGGAGAPGADSLLSATAFLGAPGPSPGPPAVPAAATAALPASSVESHPSIALLSLTDAIDNIVARSQAPSPATTELELEQARAAQQQQQQRQRSKSHLQLLSESPEFMPTAADQQQQPSAQRPPPHGSRGISPSRTKLEEHKAASLAASLGSIRSRTPTLPAATSSTEAVLTSSGGIAALDDPARSGSGASFATAPSSAHSQHGEFGDTDSTGDSELAHWNEADMAQSSRPSVLTHPTPSRSSVSPTAGTGAAFAGGPSYAELAVQNMMLRKKGAALLARFHAAQSTCVQQESIILEQRRSTDVREGLAVLQRVLQSKARDRLSRRLHQWRLFAASSSSRRQAALSLVLQRRALTDAHRASQNLSHAWDGWRSFVTHSNVALLKRRWIADWEGDLAQQSRTHACATMEAAARRSCAFSRQIDLARALSLWRTEARAIALRAAFDRERHREHEEKQVLIALVLQHRTSLEAEQKEHSELRVASQIAAAESHARMQRLEQQWAAKDALASSGDGQQGEAETRAHGAKLERIVATSRATVALVDSLSRNAQRALRSALRRWSEGRGAASGAAAADLAPVAAAAMPTSGRVPRDEHSRAALLVEDLKSPAKPLSMAADLNVSPDTLAMFEPERNAATVAPLVPLLPVPSSQQQPQPVLHDIHQLTNHRGRHSPSSSGFSAPTFSSLTSSSSYAVPIPTGRAPRMGFAPHSSAATPPPQRSSPVGAFDHARMDDVDEALRQAQETKRRLESETMEIARKIAEARARTSNFALQPQQHSHAVLPLSPGHTRSATHFGVPHQHQSQARQLQQHADLYALHHSRTRSQGSNLRAGGYDAAPSSIGHPPPRGLVAAPPPAVSGLHTRQPARSPPRSITSTGQTIGNGFYSNHFRRN